MESGNRSQPVRALIESAIWTSLQTLSYWIYFELMHLWADSEKSMEALGSLRVKTYDFTTVRLHRTNQSISKVKLAIDAFCRTSSVQFATTPSTTNVLVGGPFSLMVRIVKYLFKISPHRFTHTDAVRLTWTTLVTRAAPDWSDLGHEYRLMSI